MPMGPRRPLGVGSEAVPNRFLLWKNAELGLAAGALAEWIRHCNSWMRVLQGHAETVEERASFLALMVFLHTQIVSQEAIGLQRILPIKE